MKLALLALLPGCFLPVATGAPESATTVGRGRVGFSINGEVPTLDLIAKDGDKSQTDYTDSYGVAPSAGLRATLAFGITDSTDLELSAEGQLWFFFLPLPTGAAAGLRQHIDAGDMFDVAIAARFGGVSSGSTNTDSNSGFATNDEASAYYGSLSGVVQVKHGVFRPLVSLNVMPFKIKRAIEDEPLQKFWGTATSATFAAMFVGDRVQFGPYATLTNFESQEFKGGFFPSFGLMLAFRPDRNREPAPNPYPPGMTPPGYYDRPYSAPPPPPFAPPQ
ncbi:MAG TPA: hypothetical protein VGC41_12640 [Kofleriaceae bacterium]